MAGGDPPSTYTHILYPTGFNRKPAHGEFHQRLSTESTAPVKSDIITKDVFSNGAGKWGIACSGHSWVDHKGLVVEY